MEKAVEYYEQSLAIDLSVYGDKHPNVALRKWNLGNVYIDLIDIPDYLFTAKTYLQEAYQTYLNVLGEEHPSTKNCKSWVDHVEHLIKESKK